ncbi:prephenate dehydratase [Sulfurospirillum sp. T05]|uniref:Bifunctional chorismate mutase/prephenate dehydratase n=1 Tax=Sulfurospirillum tamanense TaxID=2813362 RepID=A0ABS2WPJ0_9BACT|nr:prephenate dehydratase [Sulfurospirillum tamanensis]
MNQIEMYRNAIDAIDDQIIALLNERMKSVKAIGLLKQTSGTSIYRPEREREILDRLKKINNGDLNDAAIEAVFFEIFAVSRNLEMPEKVAFLGPKGSYTHQVAQSRFGAMGNYLSLNCVEAVFRVLANKEAKYGVVPIENNTEGAVGETLDCLGNYDEIKIVSEIYMDIHHSFATLSEDLEHIKRIYSHPQGYNQCRKFLEEHQLLDVEFIPTKSTAEAAQKASKEPKSAAICSHIAAKLYNVPILFGKIEDNLANKTRFLILSDFKNKPGEHNKTSILAKTDDKPGGLVEFLQSFQDNKVNLTKIESRPAKERGFKTVFYLDFEGHIDDENVQNVLEQNKNKHQIKWLGSYVAGE